MKRDTFTRACVSVCACIRVCVSRHDTHQLLFCILGNFSVVLLISHTVQWLEIAAVGINQIGEGPKLPYEMTDIQDSVVFDSIAKQLYVIGSRKAITLDMETLKWTDLPPLNQPRNSTSAFMINSTLYVVGGLSIVIHTCLTWSV